MERAGTQKTIDVDPSPLPGVQRPTAVPDGGDPTEGAPSGVDAGSADLFDWALIRHWSCFVAGAPRRRPRLALAAFFATVALAVTAVVVLPRTYQTETKILASRNLVMPALGNPGRNVPGDADAPTRGAVETILRRDNLISLIDQTHLMHEWDHSRAPIQRAKDFLIRLLRRRPLDDEEKREALIYLLEKRLKVTAAPPPGETLTIEIEWPDPRMGYRLATIAQQNFLETRHALEVSTIAETISILEGHAAAARSRVDTALEEFRRAREAAKRPATAKPRPQLPAVRPAHVDAGLGELKLMLDAKRRAVRDLEEFRARRIAEIQARLSELKATYTPAHPLVVAARESVEALSTDSPQLAELRREEHELLAEYLARGGRADGDRGDLGASAPPSTPSLLQVPDILRVQDPAVEESAEAQYWRTQLETLMRKYDELVGRLDAARIELDTARAAFKYRYSIVRPAEVSKKPSRPNIPLILLAGVLGGVVLAFAVPCYRDLRAGVIVQPWQVDHGLGVPLLADLTPR
jgi:uncharacterized protein involved in exopolysaccharide biosynthesis